MELCRKFGLDVDKAIDQLLEYKKSQMKQVLGCEPKLNSCYKLMHLRVNVP